MIFVSASGREANDPRADTPLLGVALQKRLRFNRARRLRNVLTVEPCRDAANL